MSAEGDEKIIGTPFVLKILAVSFMLAPFGNIYFSFLSMKLPSWFIHQNMVWLVSQVSKLDLLWFGLTFISGLMLLKPTKASWALAMISLFAATVSSVVDLFGKKALSDSTHLSYVVLCLVSSLSIVVILYFFRFPYLDRRDRWWGVSRRYRADAEIDCRVEGSEWSRTNLINFSSSGVLFKRARTLSSDRGFKSGDRVEIKFQLPNEEKVEQGIIRSLRDDAVGVEFIPSLTLKRLKLLRWLTQSSKKVDQTQ